MLYNEELSKSEGAHAKRQFHVKEKPDISTGLFV
jgi:hypothetical protein